jgi:hypothetical protein
MKKYAVTHETSYCDAMLWHLEFVRHEAFLQDIIQEIDCINVSGTRYSNKLQAESHMHVSKT